jgi:hypothetical protein
MSVVNDMKVLGNYGSENAAVAEPKQSKAKLKWDIARKKTM